MYGHVFTHREWVRFGCDFFSNQGCEIVPVELLSYLQKEGSDTYTHETFQYIDNCLHIHNDKELEELLSGVEAQDIVFNALSFSVDLAPIYWCLHKFDIDYIAISLGKIPSSRFLSRAGARSISECIRYRIDDAKTLLYRLRILLSFLMKAEYCWKKVQPPRWWVDAGSYHGVFDIFPIKAKQAQRIPAQSFDVETAKLAEGEKSRNLYFAPEGYAVFYDSGFFGNPDFDYHSFENTVNIELYSELLKSLFRHIENKLNLKVVIALHPKSIKSTVEEYLGEWDIVEGKTSELTRGSQLVVSHGSTAISFAVFYRIPSLLVSTNELERNVIDAPIMVRISSWLKQRRIILDNQEEIENITMPVVNEEAYAAYQDAFLCESEAQITSTWQEILKHVSGKSVADGRERFSS